MPDKDVRAFLEARPDVEIGLDEYKRWPPPETTDANTRLIVASVNLLPALAAVVEAGNAAVAKLRTLHYGEPVGRDDAKVVWDLKESLSALDAAESREVG